MSETDAASRFVTHNECRLGSKHIHDKLGDIEKDVEGNTKTCDKILSIIQGNGEGGLIMKVNLLMMRNHWADKAFWVGVTMATNLITLYLTGVLHI